MTPFGLALGRAATALWCGESPPRQRGSPRCLGTKELPRISRPSRASFRAILACACCFFFPSSDAYLHAGRAFSSATVARLDFTLMRSSARRGSQLEAYEEAVMQKRLEEMPEAELEALMKEIEKEKQDLQDRRKGA